MLIETSKLRTSPNNPRAIRESKMEQLMRSIAEDPGSYTPVPSS